MGMNKTIGSPNLGPKIFFGPPNFNFNSTHRGNYF